MIIKSINIKNYKNIKHLEILNPGKCSAFYAEEIGINPFCAEICDAIEFAIRIEHIGFFEAAKRYDFPIKKQKKTTAIVFKLLFVEQGKETHCEYSIKANGFYDREIKMKGHNSSNFFNNVKTSKIYQEELFKKLTEQGKYVFFCTPFSVETLAPFVDAYRFIKEKDCEKLIKITNHGDQQ